MGSGVDLKGLRSPKDGDASEQPDARVGTILAKRYAIERLIGLGSMGVVYAVRHVRTESVLAAKLLWPRLASDASVLQRFLDEARIVAQLNHQNIVQVVDFDQDEDGTPFMIMEMLEGETLDARLSRVGKLPLSEALRLTTQVGSALHAAHEISVVHRDIKPENIFLAIPKPAGLSAPVEGEVAKILDFGISKIQHAGSRKTQERAILGTPLFMSPEAAAGTSKEVDGRADQFSLAVALYLMLSGKLPFDGANELAVLYQIVHQKPQPLSSLVPDLPSHVVAAIDRAMSKDRTARFPTMMDFVRALQSPQPDSHATPHLPRLLDVEDDETAQLQAAHPPPVTSSLPTEVMIAAKTPRRNDDTEVGSKHLSDEGKGLEETMEVPRSLLAGGLHDPEAKQDMRSMDTRALRAVPESVDGPTPLMGTELPPPSTPKWRIYLLVALVGASFGLLGASYQMCGGGTQREDHAGPPPPSKR